MERWVNTGLYGSKGKIYRKVYDDIETPHFAEENEYFTLGNLSPEGCEEVVRFYDLKKVA